jgi:hypothetical protein
MIIVLSRWAGDLTEASLRWGSQEPTEFQVQLGTDEKKIRSKFSIKYKATTRISPQRTYFLSKS